MVASTRKYTVEEYLLREQEAGERIEYYDGKLKHMPGGTINHGRIIRNLIGEFYNFTAKNPHYEVFSSDIKVYLPKYNFYLYPDAIVVAGEALKLEEEAQAITNPLLIIEVLSKSTQKYDRGQKFIEYQSLPSFKEYVLIHQDKPEAMLFFREEPDVWRSSEVNGMNEKIHFRSINVDLLMKTIFHKVEF